MIIEVSERFAHGKLFVDPRNDEAKRFAKLAGTSTLTVETIEQALQMGYKLKVIAPESRIERLLADRARKAKAKRRVAN